MPPPNDKTLVTNSGIFSKISDAINKNLPGLEKTQKQIENSLNFASNIGLSIPSTFAAPQIDPRIAGAINSQFGTEISEIAKSIFQQSGLKDLISELETAKTSETKTSTTTKKSTSDTTPTQKSNKPVEAAKQSREEGRTNLEQLFLDLINGKLDIKL